jgi:hypothetical protein
MLMPMVSGVGTTVTEGKSITIPVYCVIKFVAVIIVDSHNNLKQNITLV